MSVSPKTDSTTAQRVLDVLMRIEARHADPARWCKGAAARNKGGRHVVLESRAVYSTCLIGGRYLETRDESVDVRVLTIGLISQAGKELYPGVIAPNINDVLGYEAVRAVERKAVELAEAALAEVAS